MKSDCIDRDLQKNDVLPHIGLEIARFGGVHIETELFLHECSKASLGFENDKNGPRLFSIRWRKKGAHVQPERRSSGRRSVRVSGGLITGLVGFEEKEIRLLKSARSALGDPLFVGPTDCDGSNRLKIFQAEKR